MISYAENLLTDKSTGTEPQASWELATATVRKANEARNVPLAMRLVSTGLRAGSLLAPKMAARVSYNLFFSPQRFAMPEPERELLARATVSEVDGLRVYSWGTGPTILAVHGWSGRATQFWRFVPALNEAGYRVVALDAPAHGGSPGKQTNLFDIAAAIEKVGAAMGPFHGVVAHSIGSPATSLALERGMVAKRVVYLGPPNSYNDMIDKFAEKLALPSRVTTRLRQLLYAQFGRELWENLAHATTAMKLSQAALLIHDCQDTEVPYTAALALARAWPNAELMLTSRLGHYRILRDENVVRAAVTFFKR